ncbi:LRRN4 C-terminal-like protein [Conger conger]|nr:LRRN4 C-terminal-like protein [Conger conger]
MASRRAPPYVMVPFILALSSSYAEKHLPEGNATKTLIIPQTFGELGVNPDEDYDRLEDPTPQPTNQSKVRKSQHCAYDRCRDQQQPCVELSAATGCQCPGLTGPGVIPEAPYLKDMIQQGSKVEVQWCAPSSTVSTYQVVVKGQEPVVFTGLSRKAVLEGLEAGAEVCVEAVNAAGVSGPGPHSCMTYQPESGGSLSLKAGLIGGALGFLLLCSLAVFLLWRRKACGKSGGRSVSHTTDGSAL